IWASTEFELLRTDGNSSFSRTPSDFPNSATSFTGLAIDDSSIVWIGTWTQFTINGSTLIRLDANNGSYTVYQHDLGWPFPGEHVRPLAVTPDGRLWMQYDSEYPSDDNGLCWFDGVNVGSFPAPPGGVPQWGGLPNSNIKKLEVMEIPGGYELWMSCLGRGIAVLTVNDGTTSIDNEEESPTSFMLSQNYPNPFNPTTSIQYAISSKQFVSLKVYDVLGNEIASLVNEEKPAGTYEVQFDASAFTSGVYFYTIRTSNFTNTRKMILIK
ncbi:MAG: T9SS type A sorting domain-containing protein, partial [Ignavibacteriaceae bacterium]|nr:T9SS type A sorting domain-containing protein [Ignavibacteriaceae bacterium]